MASSGLKPKLAYIILYVRDVEKAASFYDAAFGYTVRRLGLRKWAELESGATTIAFTPLHERETDARSGEVQLPDSSAAERGSLEVCFAYADVDAASTALQFQPKFRPANGRGVKNGAVPVSSPEDKPWGQKSGFVRDMDGNVVRIASYVRA